MTFWIGYARAGKELEVVEAINALGIPCHIARKLEAVRSGKKRRPEPRISPVLPNYVFIEADTDQWAELSQVKFLANTKTVCPLADIDKVMAYVRQADTEFNARQRRLDAGERLEEFSEGDLLKIIGGPFLGRLVKFRRIVEANAADMFPMLGADFDLMGRAVEIRVDPLHVEKG